MAGERLHAISGRQKSGENGGMIIAAADEDDEGIEQEERSISWGRAAKLLHYARLAERTLMSYERAGWWDWTGEWGLWEATGFLYLLFCTGYCRYC